MVVAKKKVIIGLVVAVGVYILLPAVLLLGTVILIFAGLAGGGRRSQHKTEDYTTMSEEMFGVSPHHDGYQE